MGETHKYKNPPLIEAVFELYFQPIEWNATIPGLFYNEVKEVFPKIQNKNNGGIGIGVGSGGIQIGAPNGNMTVFKNEGGDSIIQLSHNLLTVNKLPLYTKWEDYLELIKIATKAFRKLINYRVIDRVGLKFINKIDTQPTNSVKNIKQFLNFYPQLPESCGDDTKSVQQIVEFPTEDSKEIVALTIASLLPEEVYKSPLLFQLYYIKNQGIDFANINIWLEKAHNKLYEIFEESLTEKSKELFNA